MRFRTKYGLSRKTPDKDQAEVTLPEDAAIRGFTMTKCDGRDQVACKIASDGWASFETPLPHYVFGTAKQWPGLFLDVGANTGFYTLLALSASAASFAVAIEPVSSIRRILRANIDRNGLRHRVALLRCAISDKNGSARLFMPNSDHGLIETSASLKADFKETHSGSRIVSARTLDRVVTRSRLATHAVSAIKIDVEGHEAEVIMGASAVIRQHRPIIFVEILPRSDFTMLSEFLKVQHYVDVQLPFDRKLVVGQALAYIADAWNHAFVPDEKLTAFLASG